MAAPLILESHKDRLICLIYHNNIPPDVMEQMDKVRQEYLNLASFLLMALPESRSKSLALTQLEESCQRAIQALALKGDPQCTTY